MESLQQMYKVVDNALLCPKYHRLQFEAPALAATVQPGQFVHIRTSEGLEPFFRRPFSVYRAQGTLVEVFYEVVGPGTTLLAAKQPGDMLDVIGPVGTPFTLPQKSIKHVVMVAGGIGIAPFLLLTDILKGWDISLTLLYGGRTKDHVHPMTEFKENGCVIYVATEDGSVGTKGRVSTFFETMPKDPVTTFVYTCGPMPMMAAVQAFVKQYGLSGEAACEEVMACALGACLGCSIPTTKGYRTVCYEGPVFPLHELIFEGASA